MGPSLLIILLPDIASRPPVPTPRLARYTRWTVSPPAQLTSPPLSPSRTGRPGPMRWLVLASRKGRRAKRRHTHRLECADSKVWSSITSPLASHCLQHICQEDIRCGRSCLEHVAAVGEEHRSIWRGCSMSISCQALPSAQKLSCADTCLAEQREEMERKERERRRNEE